MLRHQYVDLFEVRDAKWKKKNMNVSALFLFLPLYPRPNYSVKQDKSLADFVEIVT